MDDANQFVVTRMYYKSFDIEFLLVKVKGCECVSNLAVSKNVLKILHCIPGQSPPQTPFNTESHIKEIQVVYETFPSVLLLYLSKAAKSPNNNKFIDKTFFCGGLK